MKILKLLALFTFVFCMTSVAQTAVKFRADKQAMSTPMTTLDEVFFVRYYSARPLNINFDGTVLNMTLDNGTSFAKKNVTEVKRNSDFEDGQLRMETVLYVDNANTADTISMVTDFQIGYVEIVVPTQNAKGEYIGYTSFKNFDKEIVKTSDLAAK